MVDAVRHFSTFEWYRVEARCATCEGVSELKLVAGVFLCRACFREQDSVGFAVPDGGQSGSSSVLAPAPRPGSKCLLPNYRDGILNLDEEPPQGAST
jgi:hypothetical protein